MPAPSTLGQHSWKQRPGVVTPPAPAPPVWRSLWTPPGPSQIRGSPAFGLTLCSFSSSVLSSCHLRHTRGLAHLVRVRRPPSLSAEVAGTSHGHGHSCWLGTEGSLVRLPQTSPSSFPTSTFGSSPCPHLPVESRILPLSSLDHKERRALELGTPSSLFMFRSLLFV